MSKADESIKAGLTEAEALAKSAKRRGVSLNQYVLYLLTVRASANGEAHA